MDYSPKSCNWVITVENPYIYNVVLKKCNFRRIFVYIFVLLLLLVLKLLIYRICAQSNKRNAFFKVRNASTLCIVLLHCEYEGEVFMRQCLHYSRLIPRSWTAYVTVPYNVPVTSH